MQRPTKFNALNYITIVISILLALLPILRLIFFLATTGDNNLSNDEIHIVRIVEQVLGGFYNWKNFFGDTFIEGHSKALFVLLQILLAYLSDWSEYVSIFFGVGLAFLKLLLFYDAFTHSNKNQFRWLLLPILAFLIFSPSQLSIYEFAFTTLSQGLGQLGLALGIWGLIRFPNRWLAILLMIFGGFLASWSWGGGPLVWPIFLLGLLLLKFRRKTYFLAWFAASVIASLPYIYFLFINPNPDQVQAVVPSFDFGFIIKAIGWPFNNDLSLEVGKIKGLIGIGLCIFGIVVLWKSSRKNIFTHSIPGLLLVIFSLLNMSQIGLVRDVFAPWYTSAFMLFWIGMAGLAYAFIPNKTSDQFSFKWNVILPEILWSFAFLIIAISFYLTSNLSWSGKSTFLNSRSPVSASCLRNYKTAPTYCQQTLFNWEPGQYQFISVLARRLERLKMSVFAPHQKWTLQGDYILDNVRVHQEVGVPIVFWSADRTSTPVSFYDYRHLNLFLHTPNWITWNVSLPKNLKEAIFHSAITISSSAPYEKGSDGVLFQVSLESKNKPKINAFTRFLPPSQRQWVPFVIPLNGYAGETITIRLGSEMVKNSTHDWAMYRYPYLDLVLNEEGPTQRNDQISPSNTELNSSLPKPTSADYLFDLNNMDQWKTTNMTLLQAASGASGSTWEVGRVPTLEYQQPLNINLSDYNYFYIRLAASPDIDPRSSRVLFQVGGPEGPLTDLYIPLLSDGEMHEYTYDLRLLELNEDDHLTKISLQPVLNDVSPTKQTVQISDFRLIHRSSPE